METTAFPEQLYRTLPCTVVDVGARGGFSGFPALHSSMEVHLIEPDPAAANALRNEQPAFRKSTVYELALSDKNGTADFYLADHGSMSSLLEQDAEDFNRSFGEMKNAPEWSSSMKVKDKIQVRTQTLSDFSRENSISFIDFLKLDTQGSELTILKSGEELLRSGKVGVICTEVALFPVYKGQAYFSEIDIFLRDCGFRMVEFRTYGDVLNREDEFTMNGKLYEKPKHAPVGDAWYVYNWNPEKQTEEAKRAAVILASETYFSEAKYFLKSFLRDEEMDHLFRNLSAGVRESALKHFMRRWTPLAVQQWRAKRRR